MQNPKFLEMETKEMGKIYVNLAHLSYFAINYCPNRLYNIKITLQNNESLCVKGNFDEFLDSIHRKNTIE